ncbi:MAG TPA: glycosyltransferase family 39 protein [Chloroflexota bacterium]|nr:glycosyltransferase family 39 protein [Chloroflexota bacterium]
MVRHAVIRRGTPLDLLVVLCFALVLRLYHLGANGLWMDEAYGAMLARGSFGEIWSNHLAPDHLPAYYTLLWLSVRLLGESEWALRLPSVIAGVLSVVGGWAIGFELHRPRAGLLAATLLACSPMAIYWSQEAKPQAMAMALAVWSSFLMLAAWRRRSLGWWSAYGVVTLLGLYTFYYHLPILAAQLLVGFVWLWRQQCPRTWRHAIWWGLGHTALLATVLPWLMLRLDQMDAALRPELVPTLSFSHYLLLNANTFLGGFVGQEPWFPGEPLAATLSWTALLVGGVLMLGPMLPMLHVRRPMEPVLVPARGLTLLVAWVIVPLVSGYVLQVVVPSFWTRYLLGILPALVLLVGLAFDTLLRRPRVLRAGAIVALVVLLASWLYQYGRFTEHRPYAQPFREIAAYVLAQSPTGDGPALLLNEGGFHNVGFAYYLRNRQEQVRLVELSTTELDESWRTVSSLAEQGYSGFWLVSRQHEESWLERMLHLLAEPTPLQFEQHPLRVQYYRFPAGFRVS